MRKTFSEFRVIKENEANPSSPSKDWRKSFIALEKGFIPPSKMRPIIEAFLKSSEIELSKDTSKSPTMPKKSLFLVGGPVRDFLKGKSIKDYDLATNATPEQIAHILSNAGFAMSEDRSGKQGAGLALTFPAQQSRSSDRKTWFIKGRDASKESKPFVISAVVDGEEFEIATFRRDAKVTDGAAEVDFVDNPHEDAGRRDLTINSLYIELSKPDGENNKLYDPTGKGWHDVKNNVVRTVGKAEDRFGEDKLRIMRAIRFHSRFGSGRQMDPDIEKAIPRFKHMEGVALERIRDEFLKGLLHPDVDSKIYISIYQRTGLLQKVFPDINFDPPNSMPLDISDKKDKPLALAWLLQHNPVEKVAAALAPSRAYGTEEKQTGWTTQERRAVIYLLKLKEFSPNDLPNFLKERQGTNLTNQQIRDWVEMFNMSGTNRNRRPWWAKQVNTFADYQKSANWDQAVSSGRDICPNCKGRGCTTCKMAGKIPDSQRGHVVGNMEIENFLKKLQG